MLASACNFVSDKDVQDAADRDGDGHASDQVTDGDDCNDDDAAINPSVPEICDGVDNNCDGEVDNAVDGVPPVGAPTLYEDVDGDGYGAPLAEVRCPADGWVAQSGDCDDADTSVNPDAEEVCDEKDNDCDDSIDEGLETTTYYLNQDGDDYGSEAIEACTMPKGYTDQGGDCVDDPVGVTNIDGTLIPGYEIHPNHTDIPYDDVDQDCAGDSDWDVDTDGEECDSSIANSPCEGLGHVGTDCDDADATVNTSANEKWYDGVDQDCDGKNDFDQDEDGYECELDANLECKSEPLPGIDCDDDDDTMSPAATEAYYDGFDQNCDGKNDYDADEDGWVHEDFPGKAGGTAANKGDCDDTTDGQDGVLGADIHPDQDEQLHYDGVDDNCDPADDDDADGDGFPCEVNKSKQTCKTFQPPDMDCDEGDPSTNPGASEVWYDGIDQDCDGANDYDQDGDGYDCDGDSSQNQCDSVVGDDCDDSGKQNGIPASDINPGAEEVFYDDVDQDCGLTPDDHDKDGDGHSITNAPTGTKDDCDDENELAYSGAEEIWYNGDDNDCSGGNDFDQDGDGWVIEGEDDEIDLEAPRAGDCDDTIEGQDTLYGNPATIPGMDIHPQLNVDKPNESYYDGVDQDCDGQNDFDKDGDGFVAVGYEGHVGGTAAEGGDCEDEDELTNPGATEIWYDNIDQSCHGRSDYDQDGDGQNCNGSIDENVGCPLEMAGLDCDDNPTNDPVGDTGIPQIMASDIFDGAAETWYDGIDQNCDEKHDYDKDEDQYVPWDYRDFADGLHTGDCVDHTGLIEYSQLGTQIAGSEINVGQDEIPYDGVDQNCDRWNDFDQDKDRYVALGYSDHADDTADTDATAWLDDDCNDDPGNDDTGDPNAVIAYDINPGALEAWYDGFDQNCDGWNDFDRDRDGHVARGYADHADDTDYPNWIPHGNGKGDCVDTGYASFELADTDISILAAGQIHPNLDTGEHWYDGVDQNCDGQNDFDRDGDGYVALGFSEFADNPNDTNDTGGLSVDVDDCDEIGQVDIFGMPVVGSEINPGESEQWYDGVDEDCDGWNDFDQDHDGYVARGYDDYADDTGDLQWTSPSKDDCLDDPGNDDTDDPGAIWAADIHPGMNEEWYDGIDQNCDGWNDFDQDHDGHVARGYGEHINDTDYPNWVQHGSGKGDCKDTGLAWFDLSDTAATTSFWAGQIHPDLDSGEKWYDGVDQNCDGQNDFDKDMDGYVAVGFDQFADDPNDTNDTGTLSPDMGDCNEVGATDDYGVDIVADLINPGQVEKWYDGVDQNCDYLDDYDKDGDQTRCDYDLVKDKCLLTVGYDCNDEDSGVYPSDTGLDIDAPFDPPYDGVDQDCDGWNDYDADKDGYVAREHAEHANDTGCPRWVHVGNGIGDCIDTGSVTFDVSDTDTDDPTVLLAGQIKPNATDEAYDGIDQDCDGKNDFDRDGDGWLKDDPRYQAYVDDTDDTGTPSPNWGDCRDNINGKLDNYGQRIYGNAIHPPDPEDTDDPRSANEVWYDGVDQNCDDWDDNDMDGDGIACATDTAEPACSDNQPPGYDCDDDDVDVHPGDTDNGIQSADEIWYDGGDQNCDGLNDYDQDGDGFVHEGYNGFAAGSAPFTDDCDDDPADDDVQGNIAAATTHPPKSGDPNEWLTYRLKNETWYDGIDENCLDDDDFDKDGDSFLCDYNTNNGKCKDTIGFDCDDDPDDDPIADTGLTANEIHPGDDLNDIGENETFYDHIDQNCDQHNDYDEDGDGYVKKGEGDNYVDDWLCLGLTCNTGDCRDGNTDINPGATEAPYDGTDQDCDGWNDYDADEDGYVDIVEGVGHVGDAPCGQSECAEGDCNDDQATWHPGVENDAPYDGKDKDCDGYNDYDADEDGYVDENYDSEAGTLPCGLFGDCQTGDCVDDPDGEESVPGDEINPGAAEDQSSGCWDGVDNNCDGLPSSDCHWGSGTAKDNAYATISASPPITAIGRPLAVAEVTGDTDGVADIIVAYAGSTKVFAGESLVQGQRGWATAEGSLPLVYQFAVNGDVSDDGINDFLAMNANQDVVGLYYGPLTGNKTTPDEDINVVDGESVTFVPDTNDDDDTEDEVAVSRMDWGVTDFGRTYVFDEFDQAASTGDAHNQYWKFLLNLGDPKSIRYLAGGKRIAANNKYKLIIGGPGGSVQLLDPIIGETSTMVPLLDENEGFYLQEFAPSQDGYGRPTILGDINGDGRPEIAVSVPEHNSNKGIVAIGSELAPGSQPIAVIEESIDDNTYCGFAVISGDFNGDGNEDFAISRTDDDAVGRVDIWWNPQPTGTNPVPCVGGTNLSGSTNGDNLGMFLAAGDVTGDGIDDLLIAAPGAEILGRIYIIAGGGL
jgi:hypothetical protein